MSFIKKLVDKWSNMSLAAKASCALVFAKFFEKGLSMISAPIFTRLMDTSQYGIASTFMSWQSILFIIITLNLASGVFNNGMLDFEDDRDSFICSLSFTSMLSTLIFFGIYMCFQKEFQKILDLSHELILVMFVYFLVTPNYGYWANKQRYEFKYKKLTILTVFSAVFSLTVSIIAVIISPANMKPLSKVLGTEAGLILLAVFFTLYIFVKGGFKVKRKYIIYAIKFNIPLIPHYLSMYVLSGADRIMISRYEGTSATAIYSVAYTVASVMLIFWSAIESSYVPWLYGEMKSNNIEHIKKNVIYILGGFGVVCCLSACFAPEIIKVLATSEYNSGIYVIPAVSASVFFTALFNMYMRIELYYKNNKISMFATTIAAVSNIVLNMLLIPKFGFIAAGYTTLFCYALQALLHYFAVKYMKKQYFYDNKKILILSGIVVICSSAVQVLYLNTVLRYSFIILLLIILYINKNKLLVLFKK